MEQQVGVRISFVLVGYLNFPSKCFIVAQHRIIFGWKGLFWVVCILALQLIIFFVCSWYFFFSTLLFQGVDNICFIHLSRPGERRRMQLVSTTFPFLWATNIIVQFYSQETTSLLIHLYWTMHEILGWGYNYNLGFRTQKLILTHI